MVVLHQNKTYIIYGVPCVPNVAKNGQKSCLAWCQAYIRGFNRFIVPKNIRKDTLHGCIAPKQNIYNLRCRGGSGSKKGHFRPRPFGDFFRKWPKMA